MVMLMGGLVQIRVLNPLLESRLLRRKRCRVDDLLNYLSSDIGGYCKCRYYWPQGFQASNRDARAQ